jgi:hypothetical protein
LHVLISGWGLSLRSAGPVWKKGHAEGKEVYDLTAGERGTVLELNSPVVERREDGTLESGLYRSREEAERAVRDLKRKGKAGANIRIEEVPSRRVDIPNLGLALRVGPELRRLALKMSMAAITLLPGFDVDEVEEGRLYLLADPRRVPANNVFATFQTYEEIDSRRPPLAHVIYVERGATKVYGLVQFFGVFQLYCRLSISESTSKPAALFCALDPVTGDEAYTETEPLDLRHPNVFYDVEEFKKGSAGLCEQLGRDAVRRGANPSNIKMVSVDFGED